jgi:AraC-like DNA-binding protein
MSPDTNPQSLRSEYREFPAPLPLADYFLCFWTQIISGQNTSGMTGEYTQQVLPDGCVDIIFINQDAPVAVGPWIDPFAVDFPVGTRILGARLHPGRAPGLLGLPAMELLNQSAPFRALCGAVRDDRFERVREAEGAQQAAALGEALLADRKQFTPYDPAVAQGIRWLARNPQGKVVQLSQVLGISPRQLQRRFSTAVGYGPKTFHSVLRFQRLLRIAGQRTQSLSDLAACAGYSDQAHMTREVRRFANEVPTTLLRSAESTLLMSDLFKT